MGREKTFFSTSLTLVSGGRLYLLILFHFPFPIPYLRIKILTALFIQGAYVTEGVIK